MLTHAPIHPGADDGPALVAPETRCFDGVICFGGQDWWYHNRGHYDMQIMRRLSATMPVLYVNSIGMRTPSPVEGRMFLRRVTRKLRSIRRGFTRVDEHFGVLSAPVLPSTTGLRLTNALLVQSVRHAARRLGITRPLVWVACPTAADAVDPLDPAAVVYQRVDRYECFPGVDPARIVDCDDWLKARADLTLFCGALLHGEEAFDCRHAAFVDHGVEFDRFVAAGRPGAPEPADLADIPRPRAGFIGGIDAHTFDPDLLLDVAQRLPNVAFPLIGGSSLPAGWCDRPNVHLLGRRPYATIASYMAACDVLLMPWNRSRWIEACNPVKLKEYLATGRPVVSTTFPELTRYGDLVGTGDDAPTFAAAIRAALAAPGDAGTRQARVRGETWTAKVRTILAELVTLGIEPDRHRATATIVPAGSPAHAPAATPVIMRPTATAPRTTPRRTTVRLSAGAAERPVPLAACILLAGGLRPSPIVAECGCSILDLWPSAEGSVLDLWLRRIAALGTDDAPAPPVRIVHDDTLPEPRLPRDHRLRITLERDPRPLRGPAGLLHDVCAAYPPTAHVLVAEGSRLLTTDLVPLLRTHAATHAAVTVAANYDDAPSGLYVVRCGALATVPEVGFMDLKEQWLPASIAMGTDVRVCTLDGRGAMPLRTREQFLAAARVAARDGAEHATGAPAHAHAGGAVRVVCPGAIIEPGATVVDAVVMPGATVGANAIVLRSIVGPDAHVDADTTLADGIAGGGTTHTMLRRAA